MVEDAQTHRLPADRAGIARLAVFLGYRDPDAFVAELCARLGSVEKHYAELFEEAPSLAGPGNLVFTGTEDDPGDAGDAGAARLRRAGAGRRDGARLASRPHPRDPQPAGARDPDRVRARNCCACSAAPRNPDTALLRFDQFLSHAAGRGAAVLAVPRQSRPVCRWSPTSWPRRRCSPSSLAQRPALLDAVLTAEFSARLPDRDGLAADLGALLAGARDFEDTLDLLRRWANERRFQVGVQLLRRAIDGNEAGAALADIADAGARRAAAARSRPISRGCMARCRAAPSRSSRWAGSAAAR